MPIETTTTGAVIITGEKGIELYQLISLKSALKLQRDTGMRPNRYTNPRVIAKKWTGLKTNDFDKLLEGVQKLIDDLNPQVTRIQDLSPGGNLK